MDDQHQRPTPPAERGLRPRRFKVWEHQFLEALRKKGSVSAAALVCDIDTKTAYNRRKKDPRFAAEWDRIVNACNDLLEAAAFERAVHGVTRKKFYRDQVIGEEREYSDALVQFLLEKRMPMKYGRFGLEDRDENETAAKIRDALRAMRATVQPPLELQKLNAELAELRSQLAAVTGTVALAQPKLSPRSAAAQEKLPEAPEKLSDDSGAAKKAP